MCNVKIFTILKKMAQKLGMVSDYVVESGKSGMWAYQKWDSRIVRLWGTYTGSIAAYAQSTFLVPVQKYPFKVYDAHDVACARVDTGSGIFIYGYDDKIAGWSGVIATMNTYPAGTKARIVAKIQVTGWWKEFTAGEEGST